jgi:hypothetical protein
MNGEMKILFSDNMLIPKQKDSINSKKMKISLKSQNDEPYSTSISKWIVLDYKKNELLIKLYFIDPKLVSSS